WAAENLTTGRSNIGTQFRLASDPVVVNLLQDGVERSQHVFGRNSNGDLIHYYWFPSRSWAAENLTTGRSNIGTQFRLASDPVVVNLLQDGSTKEWSQRVFGRSSKGDLIHYHWSPSTSWSAENLTTGWPDTGTQFRFVSDPVTLDCPNLDEEGRAYCTFPNF
ncbi:MAG: hypothetical protein KDJ31_19195, partial [Candidatus Competibacteraceae bacterium]|nr:hypothetical protein [Candidatus Competibacteraceae bacterium]